MSKIRPAQATLNELNGGQTMSQLAEAIHHGIAATKEFGKDATVTLTITIGTMKEQGRLVNPPILMAGEVTTKFPKAPPPQTVFFVDDDGNATRQQTREPELTGLKVADPVAAQK